MKKPILIISSVMTLSIFFSACQRNQPVVQSSGAAISGTVSGVMSGVQSNNESVQSEESAAQDDVSSVTVNNTIKDGYYYTVSDYMQKSIAAGSKTQVIARLNDSDLTQFQLDQYIIHIKMYLKKSTTEKELFESFVKQELIYQKAGSMFTASEEEIQKAADENYKSLSTIKEGRKILKEYCKSHGIKQDEYIEYIKPEMKKQVLYQKLYAFLEQEHQLKNESVDMKTYEQNYTDNLYKTAKIEILKESLK